MNFVKNHSRRVSSLWNNLKLWQQKLLILLAGTVVALTLGAIVGLVNDTAGGIVFALAFYASFVYSMERKKP